MQANQLFNKFPILNLDDTYYLRDVRRSDAPRYLEYTNHPEVAKYIPDGCLPKDITSAEKELQYMRDLFNRQQSIYWTIARRDDDSMIGTCGFESWNQFHKRLELAYDTNANYWRQGITTMALEAIFDFAFANMQAERIEAYTTVCNVPSKSLLKKLGFTEEGCLRNYRHFKGKQIDIALFGYTLPDHQARQPSFIEQVKQRLKRQ